MFRAYKEKNRESIYRERKIKCCVIYVTNNVETKYTPLPSYRGSIRDRKDLQVILATHAHLL